MNSTLILKRYFEEVPLVQADLDSFNNFIEHQLDKIIAENKEIEPTIIPTNVDEFKIKLDKIWVGKPEIIEADGSKRPVYPTEARLRRLTYSAPVFMEVSAHVNGVQRESFKTQICNMPIMIKSKNCHLAGMSREDLMKHNEDPDDPGGYFIVNGTEKAVVKIEDLAPNKILVDKASTGVSKFVGKIFSEKGSYKIPHTVEKLKDGIFYLSFTRVKRIPVVAIIKALGMLKDEEILKAVNLKEANEVFINLYDFVETRAADDALDYVAKKIGITQSRDIRIERMQEIVDKYLLPHIGVESDSRLQKAVNLCKYLRKFIQVARGDLPTDDKDHYMNKRLKLSGDLMADLFRANLKVLVGDMLYNFQRIVKRGKFPTIRVLIREKLLTQRIYSALATGSWVGGRKGVSQRISRMNYIDSMSQLGRVISPLSATQENLEARALHGTHLGKLCPSESPEGTNIGLRKNMALLATVTPDVNEAELIEKLKEEGLQQ